jgi:hypothetical protein
MEINLTEVLDELIVLHAGVATTLLGEFPKAFGATFFLRAHDSTALPKRDVQAGQVSEYGDSNFERRSEELLREIAPRVREILKEVAPLGLGMEELTIGAKRQRIDDKIAVVNIVGAFSAGVGSVLVRRNMLAAHGRVLADTPTECHVVGMVEDKAAVPAIEEAAGKGIRSGLDHLIGTNLLLSNFGNMAPLKKLVDSFQGQPECEVRYGAPICRLVSKAVQPAVTMFLTSESYETMHVPTDETGQIIREYDPVRGFDLDPSPTAVQTAHAVRTP